LALVAFSLAGCEFLRDPMGTLDRVRGGQMRVGVVANEPWTRLDGRPSGVEVELEEIDATAAHLKEEGAVPVPVEELARVEMPVAAHGWQLRAWGFEPTGVELPEEGHVMAVPPGENGWLVRLERFLGEHRDEAEDLLSLILPIAFLVAARFNSRPPNDRFPHGFHRTVSIAHHGAAFALFCTGTYLLIESVAKLISAEHPTIGTVSLFGQSVWLMLPALAWSAVPAVFLGRLPEQKD
jgi:hypothetical protein